jgi:hypothetical protein
MMDFEASIFEAVALLYQGKRRLITRDGSASAFYSEELWPANPESTVSWINI